MHIPLKVTTDYTLLKSLIKIPDLISFLREKNITACGICDENLYGVLDFYFSCKKNNIKPIIGLNVKLDNLDIYLYAINYDGFKNLLKIHTKKEKNELKIDDILKYEENILVVIPYESKELFPKLSGVNKLYISYKNTYEKINSLVLTKNVLYINDLRVIKKEDVNYLKYLDKLRNDNVELNTDCFFNTEVLDTGLLNEVIDMIDIEIPLNKRYIPKYSDNSYEVLKNLCIKGLSKRLNGNVNKIYADRLKYELDVINKMGFVDYFLIVYDYVLYAKKNNILVGPGRGSAAGSLVSYSIGITEIDPLKFGLMFERFLNPERVTMPDIDIDFDAYKREEVIGYVRKKYGFNRVALGLTFTTLKSKLVLRELGKIFNISNNLLDNFIKNINGNVSLKDNLNNENIKKFINNYKEIKELYIVAIHLEGLKKNTSTHAAGVIICSEDLDDLIPVHYDNNTLVTGSTMEFLEAIGLLKMDFLAVKNLSTIANILEKIGPNKLKNISLEERDVYKLFSSGKTDGIFQFETPLLKSLTMNLKPTCFNDLVALLALGRPGTLDMAKSFIRRKNHQEKVDYIDETLEGILKSTYGIILYQEQIMAILRLVGGYTLAEADLVRRAISKKKENVIKSEEEKFINKAKNNGYNEVVARKIYSFINKFASFGFNKSHSVAYAHIAYEMAYLKVKYPEYFIIEMINNKDSDKINSLVNFLKNKGFKILKPDINISKDKYFVSENTLIMPFSDIKGISKDIATKIAGARGNGYSDVFEFLNITKDFINEDIFKILVKSGVFDSFNVNRHTLIENIDVIFNYVNLSDGSSLIEKPLLVEVSEYSDNELREMEYDLFGYFISNHPSSKYKNVVKLDNLEKYLFKTIKCVVLIERIKMIKTKKNEDMAFFSASDEVSKGNFTVFPKNIDVIKDLYEHDLVEVTGLVSKRFDKVSVIVNNISKVV